MDLTIGLLNWVTLFLFLKGFHSLILFRLRQTQHRRLCTNIVMHIIRKSTLERGEGEDSWRSCEGPIHTCSTANEGLARRCVFRGSDRASTARTSPEEEVLFLLTLFSCMMSAWKETQALCIYIYAYLVYTGVGFLWRRDHPFILFQELWIEKLRTKDYCVFSYYAIKAAKRSEAYYVYTCKESCVYTYVYILDSSQNSGR